MDALTVASEDNDVHVDLRGGGPGYTVSTRPRVHNGGDNTTDGGQARGVPAGVGPATHRDVYTQRQQHFGMSPSEEGDGNEGGSEGQASDCDGGGRSRATGHGEAEGGRGAGRAHRPADEAWALPDRAIKRKWKAT